MDYQSIYDELCGKAKSEQREKNSGIYYEGHHILPKCLGGLGKSNQTNHPNIVLLTGREHYVAHKLLHFIHPENIKLARAFWAMVSYQKKGRNYRVSSKEYEYLQKIAAQAISGQNNPIHKMDKNPFSEPSFIERNRLKRIGTISSEETKRKISIAHKGKKLSEEHKKSIGDKQRGIPRNPESVKKTAEKNRGKKRSPEFVKTMSEIRKGVPAPQTSNTNRIMNTQKYTCPHCDREIGGRANFVRFHNENCKLNKIQNGNSL